MPISVPCSCGKTLRVKDELAGKRGKCPACGTLLTIPLPAKPVPAPVVEEEWGLAPLDDDEKPAQPAPKISQPSPAPKPVANAATPSAKAAPANKSLGGPAPAPLDLPPLDNDLFGTPAAPSKPAASKPGVNAAATSARAALANKNLGGAAPAPLDLAPLEGGEEHNHAAWIDIGSESHFKVTGAPLSADTGQIFAGPSAPAPADVPPGGLPGQLLCPFCNKDLDIVTASDVMPQLALGALTGIHLSVAPFNCRNCGPIEHKQLIGESIKTVKKKAAEKDRAFFKGLLIFLLIIGVLVSVPIYIMPWWNDWRRGARHQEAIENGEKIRLEWEERSKASRERFEKEELERQQRFNLPPMGMPGNYPTGPMPGPRSPRPAQPKETQSKTTQPKTSNPVNTAPTPPTRTKSSPLPTPKPTQPMKQPPASPFEETTLPPTPAPKPMPVNPFQPLD